MARQLGNCWKIKKIKYFFATNNIRGGGHSFFLSMLLVNHFFELLIIPVLHGVIFVTHVNVHGTLLHFTFNGQVMGEFASVTFTALTSFEEGANNGLGIRALFDFLALDGPEMSKCRNKPKLLHYQVPRNRNKDWRIIKKKKIVNETEQTWKVLVVLSALSAFYPFRPS